MHAVPEGGDCEDGELARAAREGGREGAVDVPEAEVRI